MCELYDKRHGLKETEKETKQQIKIVFNNFFREVLEMNLVDIGLILIDVHRLPQHPTKKAGKRVIRPIIVKVMTAFQRGNI